MLDPVQAALLKAMEAREGGARVARSAAWDKKAQAFGGNARPGGRGPPPGRHSSSGGGREMRGGPPPARHSNGGRGDGGGGKGPRRGSSTSSATSGKSQVDILPDNVGTHLLSQPWTWWYSEYPKAKKAGNWNEHAQVQLSCMG